MKRRAKKPVVIDSDLFDYMYPQSYIDEWAEVMRLDWGEKGSYLLKIKNMLSHSVLSFPEASARLKIGNPVDEEVVTWYYNHHIIYV